jgi:hypothetical protein
MTDLIKDWGVGNIEELLKSIKSDVDVLMKDINKMKINKSIISTSDLLSIETSRWFAITSDPQLDSILPITGVLNPLSIDTDIHDLKSNSDVFTNTSLSAYASTRSNKLPSHMSGNHSIIPRYITLLTGLFLYVSYYL